MKKRGVGRVVEEDCGERSDIKPRTTRQTTSSLSCPTVPAVKRPCTQKSQSRPPEPVGCSCEVSTIDPFLATPTVTILLFNLDLAATKIKINIISIITASMSDPSSSSSSSSDGPYPRPYDGITPAPQYFKLTLDAPLVLRISLSNSKVNQWNDTMTHSFHSILSHISTDPNIAVLLLTGEGDRAFCAGLDVTSGGLVDLIEEDPARSAWKLKRHIEEFQASLSMLEGCGKPVVAAVHGVAYGLGVDLMSACDVRYADVGARFSIREVVSISRVGA